MRRRQDIFSCIWFVVGRGSRSYERKYIRNVWLLAGTGADWRLQSVACTGYWIWDCSCVWYVTYGNVKSTDFHVVFAVILGCCCCRFRIPRTKQEIEADYRRKQLAKKFKEKLILISNTDMETMDLPRGGFLVLFACVLEMFWWLLCSSC